MEDACKLLKISKDTLCNKRNIKKALRLALSDQSLDDIEIQNLNKAYLTLIDILDQEPKDAPETPRECKSLDFYKTDFDDTETRKRLFGKDALDLSMTPEIIAKQKRSTSYSPNDIPIQNIFSNKKFDIDLFNATFDMNKPVRSIPDEISPLMSFSSIPAMGAVSSEGRIINVNNVETNLLPKIKPILTPQELPKNTHKTKEIKLTKKEMEKRMNELKCKLPVKFDNWSSVKRRIQTDFIDEDDISKNKKIINEKILEHPSEIYNYFNSSLI